MLMRPAHALALLLTLLLGACAGFGQRFEEPKIELMALEALPMTGFNPGFRAQLRITNPNERALAISGLYYELALEGHDLASGTVNGPINVAGYSSQTVESVLQASLGGGLKLAADLLSRPRNQIGYTLTVKLSVGGVPIPLRIRRSGTVALAP